MNSFGYKNNKESEINRKAYHIYNKDNDERCRLLAHERLKYATEYNKTLNINKEEKDYDYSTTPIDKLRSTLFLRNVTSHDNCFNLKSDNSYDTGHNIMYKDLLDIILELWDKQEHQQLQINKLKNENVKLTNELYNRKSL